MSIRDCSLNTHSGGDVIGGGRYSLHVTLGESGLVWLAQDEVEQRLVVIRFFSRELREDMRAFDTLKARAGRLLDVAHPALCRAIEWYEADGVEPFFVCEYVDGEAASRPGTPVSWSELQRPAADVAAALEALHAAGSVHHGLSPDNIFLCAEGAKVLNAGTDGVLHNPLFVPSTLLQPAVLRCCSPQQVAGHEPHPSDDFYSFAATLYELMAGTPLFEDAKRLLAGEREDVTARALEALHRADVPGELAEFFVACLDHDPARRPVSFGPLMRTTAGRGALDAPAAAGPVSGSNPVIHPEIVPAGDLAVLKRTRAVRRPSRLPFAAVAAVVLCAVAAGGAWFIYNHQAEQQRADLAAQQQAQREAERVRQLVEDQKREAALREAQRQHDLEASQQAEAELKRKETEAVQLAAAEAERREVHATVEAPQPVLQATPRVARPLTASGADGFVSLFNGRDLSDWTGESGVWSVMDGCITAQLPANAVTHKRHYLVWNKGTVDDFELEFSYRFRVLRGNKQPNGGVIYRASTNSSAELSSYQFDVVADAKNIGAVNEDKRRYRICGYGDSAIARMNDKTEIVDHPGDTNWLAAVRAEDWNRCVIIARGNHLTHYVNGQVSADLLDENTRRSRKAGLIALELNAKNTNNPATFLQFRDLKLKRLRPESTLLSAAE